MVSEPTRNGKPFLRDTLTRLLDIAESGADTTPKIHRYLKQAHNGNFVSFHGIHGFYGHRIHKMH